MSYAMAPMPNTPQSIIAIGGYGHDDLMHGNKKYCNIPYVSRDASKRQTKYDYVGTE
jgi:hypothetical protein